MSRYLGKRKSDHGDFSTSFADLVFGLLFFFFLLAIAMVFNRPEVDAFQKKVDEMQHELNKRTEIIKKMQSKLTQEQLEIERLKRKKKPPKKPIIEEKVPDNLDLKKELERVEKERDKLQQALNELLNKYQELQKELDKLRAEKREDSAKLRARNTKLLEQLKRMKKNVRELEAELDQLSEQTEKAERHSKEIDAILKRVKNILKQKGLTDILAEVEKMEDALEESERENIGEDELFNDYKIWAEYDPNYSNLAVEFFQGESLLDSNPSFPLEEIVILAKDLAQEYKELSEDYTELEKREHVPRIFIRVHPDSVYGQVQMILGELRKGGIPVSIVPWEKKP